MTGGRAEHERGKAEEDAGHRQELGCVRETTRGAVSSAQI